MLIRLATLEDAAAVHAIYAPVVRETVISFEYEPPSVETIAERIRRTLVEYPWLVFENEDRVLGYACGGAHSERAAYQWSVDSSIYIDSSARRMGIGRALYTSLFAVFALQGFYNVFAGVTLPNEGSVGLHEAFGFEPVGVYRDVGYKMGAWHAVGWWSRRLREPDSEPARLLSLAEAQTLPSWDSALKQGLKS